MFKSTMEKILLVIAVLAIGTTIYQSFFSDRARMLKELQKLIEQREEQLKDLAKQYDAITKREKQSLQKIAELKAKLDNLQALINEGEDNLDDIKNKIPDIDSDLDFLDDFTRGTLDSLDAGRGLLSQPPPGTE